MGPYASEGFLRGGKGRTEFISSAGYVSCCVVAAGRAFGGSEGGLCCNGYGSLSKYTDTPICFKDHMWLHIYSLFSSCSTGLDSGTVILIDGK